MATVNKDFKIKSGLVVEGLQGTINGEVILTENASDSYILGLTGGATLVKSVSNEFDVSAGGELSLDRTVVDAYYDAAGSADDAETAANSYTDGRETAITTAYQGYADQAETDAKAYTDTRETAITTAYQGYADQAETDAKAYTDTRETAITSAYQSYADTAEQDAKNYADDLINDASSSSTEVWSAYKTSTEIGLAQAAAELHADNAVAALVDSAPATLDTLNELAAALQDNPDIIGDLQDIAAGKQDTLTAGSNIDITGSTISVTGLDSADISDFNTAALSATSAAYDAAGSAQTAEDNAIAHADALTTSDIEEGTNLYFTEQRAIDAVGGTIASQIDELTTDDIEEGSTNEYFTDARAKSSAADLLTGANLTNITITGTGAGLTITAENGVADSTTSDLAEGTNLYFTDSRARDAVDGTDRSFTSVELNSVAKQVAATLSAPTAGIQVAHAFAKADYRSAEYLVKVAYGTHTEISKVLLTLDSSDNIAITEYGIVGTNGSASSISAGISGANVQLQVTTANVNSTVTVVGTLLA
jgi:hypothetical protein